MCSVLGISLCGSLDGGANYESGGGGGGGGGGGVGFFFFQAEDGIRDWSVTGVQTCALPICWGYGGVDYKGGWIGLCGRFRFDARNHKSVVWLLLSFKPVESEGECLVFIGVTICSKVGWVLIKIGRASCRERV